jgi:bacterioferritin
MKGDQKIIDTLNKALSLELSAINQYFLQARMCDNWGYKKLGAHHYAESIDEMKHADQLVQRILFLEGTPNITKYTAIRIGADVKAQLENDVLIESEAIKTYNEGIQACLEAKDSGSREILELLLKGSEEALDWLETQLHVISGVGLDNYLSQQLGGGEKQ